MGHLQHRYCRDLARAELRVRYPVVHGLPARYRGLKSVVSQLEVRRGVHLQLPARQRVDMGGFDLRVKSAHVYHPFIRQGYALLYRSEVHMETHGEDPRLPEGDPHAGGQDPRRIRSGRCEAHARLLRSTRGRARAHQRRDRLYHRGRRDHGARHEGAARRGGDPHDGRLERARRIQAHRGRRQGVQAHLPSPRL